MAEGFAPAYAGQILDHVCNNNTIEAMTPVWIELHTAAPGAAGTTASANSGTRQQAVFATVAGSDGIIANTAAVTFTSVTDSADYTHFTAWSAATAGLFKFSGAVTANPVTAGDNFEVAIGALTLTMTVAS